MDQNNPTYMHQKRLETDPSGIPLLQSPTKSNKLVDNQLGSKSRIESKLEDLQPMQKEPPCNLVEVK
jgi:hypothetical protein